MNWHLRPKRLVRRINDGALFTTWQPATYGEDEAMANLAGGGCHWSFRRVEKVWWFIWRNLNEKWRIDLKPGKLRARNFRTGFKVVRP